MREQRAAARKHSVEPTTALGPADVKVVVLFKQTGDAPILKQNKVKIGGQEQFAKLVEFLRRKLGRDQVFVYLKEAFSPALEERISTLYSAFGVDGRLVVNYALTPAWG